MTENKNLEEFNNDFLATRKPLLEWNLNKIENKTLELIVDVVKQELKEIRALNNESIKTKRKIELWILIWKLSQWSWQDNKEINEFLEEINKIVDKSTVWRIRATMDIFCFNNKQLQPEDLFVDKPFYKDRNNNILFREKNIYDSVIIVDPKEINIAVEILNEWYTNSVDKTPLSQEEIEKLIENKRNIIAQENHRKKFEKNN